MKKYFLKISLCLIVLMASKSNAQEVTTVSMTYIGGSGFLLESAGKKVLIDGEFTSGGADGFMIPSSTVIRTIANSFAPFKDIDVFLVSHSHGDHFDPTMMNKCMQDNPKAVLVCHADAANSLKTVANSNYENYKNRIFIPGLAKFKDCDTIINGVGLRITQSPSFPYHDYGVLYFNIEINGFKFLHLLGPEMSSEKYSAPFNDPQNDILLVGNDYFGPTTILENTLKYKIAFVNHIYQYSGLIGAYLTKCSELRKKGHQVYVFQKAMEKYQFTKTGTELKMDTMVYTSVKKIDPAKNSISIFPNPASGIIQVNNLPADRGNNILTVFDNSGKFVFRKLLGTENQTIDCSSLPNGNYVFLINNGIKCISKNVIISK